MEVTYVEDGRNSGLEFWGLCQPSLTFPSELSSGSGDVSMAQRWEKK